MSAPRALASLYVAVALHAVFFLGLALAPAPQQTQSMSVGLMPDEGVGQDASDLIAALAAVKAELSHEAAAESPESQPSRPMLQLPESAAEASVEQAEARYSDLNRLDGAPEKFSLSGSGANQSYLANLRAHLAAHRRALPASLGSAETIVSFALSASGQASAIRIEESSGMPLLDAAAIELIERAEPLPLPPASLSGRLLVPLRIESR